MTLLFDENISEKIARALRELGWPVQHALEFLPRGTTDADLLSLVQSHGWLLVTQDKKMGRKPHQRRAMMEAGVGAFVFTGRAEKSLTEMTVLVMQCAESIFDLALRTPPPFIIGISDKRKVDRLG